MMKYDFIVIGSGIAGASIAANLAASASVIILERESRPGYHSTGRSAALFSQIYGNEVIRALTRASRAFLFAPPAGFSSDPLVRPRGSLFIATAEQLNTLTSFSELEDIAPATRMLARSEIRALCPVLRDDFMAGALLEPDSCDLDVYALHQGFLRLFRGRGGVIAMDADVGRLQRDGKRWLVSTGSETYAAPTVINAAGAWADGIAQLAGIAPLGLQPYRRTALMVEPPANLDVRAWPMVIDIDEKFYFKPDGARLLVSPADETPTDPSDVQPDEWDVAVAVDRIETATTLRIDRVSNQWAGLRTFAPDRTPVVGFTAALPGFFWLAGQGGYGIQTAPALARAAAALAQREPLPADLHSMGLREEHLSPTRFSPVRS